MTIPHGPPRIMNNSRSRLACTACTRRKVKCSKTVPCTNCIRRGEQSSCSTSDPSNGSAPPHYEASSTVSSTSSPTAARDHHELTLLRRRVADLESELQDSKPTPTASLPPLHPPQHPPHTPSLPHIGPLSAGTLPPREPQYTPRNGSGAKADPDGPGPRDAVVEDAASILEFLAWGRRKNPDYQTVASPQQSKRSVSQLGDVRHGFAQPDATVPEPADNFDDLSSPSVLQLLLPSQQRTWELVLWHERCLLWYHCSYYAPTLRSQLENFYDRCGGSIEHPEVNLQWVAFLFSVLTGSITCVPQHTAQNLGFSDQERETLSKKWCQAVISCLNKADYTANHSILSVQAIATLTISAHMLGFSNLQSIHLAAAVKISQGLGLHKLTADTPGRPEDREAGLRAWAQLCCQDWWSIPFSETYLINPLYNQSDLPMNCKDHEVVPLSDDVPTVSSYCRFAVNFAMVMPRLQDSLMTCNTAFTKYEQVMKYDKQIKHIFNVQRPLFLSSEPIDPMWPEFVPWARRAHAISSAHKIIMVHRTFLTESFVNPAFAFTRKTCLAAAKTIVIEYSFVVQEDGPVLWLHQAFAIAASIILVLDVLHRDAREPEVAEHLHLVETCSQILRACRNSMIALRGVKLLSALLEEAASSSRNSSNRKRKADETDGGYPSSTKSSNSKKVRIFNIPEFVKSYCDDSEKAKRPPVVAPQDPIGTAGFAQNVAADLFFDAGALEGASFENLLYLANQDFFTFPAPPVMPYAT